MRIIVDAAAVPVADGATRDQALNGGEEYELVVAGRALDVAAFAAAHRLALTPIATTRAPMPGEAHGVDITGVAQRVAPSGGHDHLSG